MIKLKKKQIHYTQLDIGDHKIILYLIYAVCSQFFIIYKRIECEWIIIMLSISILVMTYNLYEL